MIRAFVSESRPHTSLHCDPSCDQAHVPSERCIRLELSGLSEKLLQLLSLPRPTRATREGDQGVWVEVDLEDKESERAILAFALRRLGRRYGRLKRMSIETHCERPTR